MHLPFSISIGPFLGTICIISQMGRCHSLWLSMVSRIKKKKIVGMAHMNLLVLVSVSYLRFILHTRKCWISFSPAAAVAAAKSLQSCPTLCDPTDGSPPGSPVPEQEYWSGLPFPSPMHGSEK